MSWCILRSWFVFLVSWKKTLLQNVCYISGWWVHACPCVCCKEQSYFIPTRGIALSRKPKLLRVNPDVPPLLHYLTELMKLFVMGFSAAFGPRTVISGQITSVQQDGGQLISAPFSIRCVASEQRDHIRAAVTLTRCKNRFFRSALLFATTDFESKWCRSGNLLDLASFIPSLCWGLPSCFSEHFFFFTLWHQSCAGECVNDHV